MAKVIKPLEAALAFEKEGREFFTEASSKSGDPLTKEIYDYLAYMETKHMEDIIRISEELKAKGMFPSNANLSETTDKKSIFKEELDKIAKDTLLPQDEVTALRNALALEVKGREMYLRFSEEAEGENERSFFNLLAEEEQKHFEIIYEFLDYFESKGLKMQE